MKIIDLRSIDMMKSIPSLLYHKGQVSVIFDNGETVPMSPRKLIFHMIFWSIGRKWKIDIVPDFIVDTSFIYDSTISDIGSKLFDAIHNINPSCYDFVFDINEAVNYLNKFIIDNCQEYHQSLSIVDLAKIAYIPEIKTITDDKVVNIETSIQNANEQIKSNFKKLFEELKKPYQNNTLHNFVNLRFVKATALAHIFYQIGFRTDIDDNTIRYPIQGNYLDGLLNTVEYCLESLSAKKAMFYNRDSLPTAEYFARKQHILSSCIQHLYKGDCGSTVTLPFFVNEDLTNVVLYKNIIDGNRIVTLTPSNVGKYVGKIINMRTPIGCKYVDGVCETCGGKLLSNMPPNTHIGMFSAIRVASVITQVILSSKHVQETAIVEYTIPEALKNFFVKHQGAIFVKPNLREKFKKMVFIFKLSDTMHLRELVNLNIARLSSINESSFGKCHEIVIMKGSNLITEEVDLGSNDQFPMYSKQFIKYIAEHPDSVTIRDDMFMVSMSNYEFKDPIFKLVVMNNSMVKFVNNAKKLVESGIKRYTSATELINDFSNLVYSQVKVNIAYLEVAIRAALITDKHDYRIPVISNIDNVMFTTNPSANMLRSVGILCAFQQLPASLRNPNLYLIPRTYTSFDEFLNLKPKTTPFLLVDR